MTGPGYDSTKPIMMAAFTKSSVLRATVTQCDSTFPAQPLWYPASMFPSQAELTKSDCSSEWNGHGHGVDVGGVVQVRLATLAVGC